MSLNGYQGMSHRTNRARASNCGLIIYCCTWSHKSYAYTSALPPWLLPVVVSSAQARSWRVLCGASEAGLLGEGSTGVRGWVSGGRVAKCGDEGLWGTLLSSSQLGSFIPNTGCCLHNCCWFVCAQSSGYLCPDLEIHGFPVSILHTHTSCFGLSSVFQTYNCICSFCSLQVPSTHMAIHNCL